MPPPTWQVPWHLNHRILESNDLFRLFLDLPDQQVANDLLELFYGQ